jgi:hypothetical protein
MNGFDVFKTYQAIKLHFTSPSYNYFVYNGKTNATLDSFERRRDKFMFHKLARKYDEQELVYFLVANFVEDNHKWTKDLLGNEAAESYMRWKKTTESIGFQFQNDMQKLLEEDNSPKAFNQLFVVSEGSYPKLLEKLMQKEVKFETVTILNSIMNFTQIWDKQIDDDIVYPKLSLRIRKYGAFLSVDVKKYKNILLSLMNPI